MNAIPQATIAAVAMLLLWLLLPPGESGRPRTKKE